ncbi:LuxR C-terminal-related transcriptional regulator [Demetria terragena]|uniref:LuxR C-terminal-related transcriptional regulator n=1 Tax=Demetria terragena TaxID=63959 RepID=UPI0003649E92|nr:LuxR C-terminal-related transcriptional regulator [Demetria terragena]
MGTGEFSANTIAILRNADRRLRSADLGDLTARYAAVKAALASLAPLDAFYIGHFHQDSLILSYVFDGDQRIASEVLTIGKGGVSDWIRISRKPYIYAEDRGHRLHRGAPIGDATQLSKDCVFTPIMSGNEAIGLVSSQSLTANTFSEEFLRAQMWMTRALELSLRHDTDSLHDDLYAVYPELNSEQLRNEGDLINRVGERLDELAQSLRRLSDEAAEHGLAHLAEHAEAAVTSCDRVQTEVSDLVRTFQPWAPPTDLTPREIEVALLIANDGLTNAQLSETLHISIKTVKTHVGNVLRKLGITQRSEIAWTLPPALRQQSPA